MDNRTYFFVVIELRAIYQFFAKVWNPQFNKLVNSYLDLMEVNVLNYNSRFEYVSV